MGVSDDDVHFTWDNRKAASNLRKHGVSFEAATFVFDDPRRLEDADVFARGEYRNVIVAAVQSFVLTVIYTEPEEGLIRIISARLATPTERKAYEQHLFRS